MVLTSGAPILAASRLPGGWTVLVQREMEGGCSPLVTTRSQAAAEADSKRLSGPPQAAIRDYTFMSGEDALYGFADQRGCHSRACGNNYPQYGGLRADPYNSEDLGR